MHTWLQVSVIVLYIVHKFRQAPETICFCRQEVIIADAVDIVKSEL